MCAVDGGVAPRAALGATPPALVAQSADTTSDSESSAPVADDAVLAASTAPPWVPPTPLHFEAGWEKGVRFPLRVATFPLHLIGRGLESVLTDVEENSFVARTTETYHGFIRAGLNIAPSSLGDRTGFGARAVYRPVGLDRIVGFDFSGTLNQYNRTRVDVHYGPAEIAYQYDWRPRERFFGYGMSASNDEPSTFAVREQGFRAALAYPWRAPAGDRIREQLRVWGGPREARLLRGREAPSFEEVYADAAPLFGERQEHLVAGLGMTTDRRYGKPHWTHGGRLSVDFERFDDQTSKTLAIRTPRGDSPDFFRLTIEAEGGFSFGRDPRTLRLGVRTIHQGDEASVGRLLPYDLSTLGGNQGLAGFEPGRFRDVDMAVGKVTYLFSLLTTLEFEIHAETGEVYPRVAAMRADKLESSYGIAFRPRQYVTTGLVGVDWSKESVRIRFVLGAVE
jgi:hypothetical protein